MYDIGLMISKCVVSVINAYYIHGHVDSLTSVSATLLDRFICESVEWITNQVCLQFVILLFALQAETYNKL
jgi:hypothetical protein